MSFIQTFSSILVVSHLLAALVGGIVGVCLMFGRGGAR